MSVTTARDLISSAWNFVSFEVAFKKFCEEKKYRTHYWTAMLTAEKNIDYLKVYDEAKKQAQARAVWAFAMHLHDRAIQEYDRGELHCDCDRYRALMTLANELKKISAEIKNDLAVWASCFLSPNTVRLARANDEAKKAPANYTGSKAAFGKGTKVMIEGIEIAEVRRISFGAELIIEANYIFGDRGQARVLSAIRTESSYDILVQYTTGQSDEFKKMKLEGGVELVPDDAIILKFKASLRGHVGWFNNEREHVIASLN